MHAVSRLALHPLIPRIQASWVKLGPTGAAAALLSGANDMGGTLMNESISRAAGAAHGQELAPEAMEALIRSIGRQPRQRTTLCGQPPGDQVRRSFGAPALSDLIQPTDLRFLRAGKTPASRRTGEVESVLPVPGQARPGTQNDPPAHVAARQRA